MVSASGAQDVDLLAWRCDEAVCPVAWECLGEGLRTRADGLWGSFVLREGREVAA